MAKRIMINHRSIGWMKNLSHATSLEKSQEIVDRVSLS